MTILITFLAILFGLLSAFSIQYISKDTEVHQLLIESKYNDLNNISQDKKTSSLGKIESTARLMYSLREFIKYILVLIYITASIIYTVIYLNLNYIGFKFYPNNFLLLKNNIKIEVIELIASGLITLLIVVIIPIILYKNTSLREKLFGKDLFVIWYNEIKKNKINYKTPSDLYSVLESPKKQDK